MDSIIVVFDNESSDTLPPSAMPVLKQWKVEDYRSVFASPAKIDGRRLPKLAGLRYQWHSVERGETIKVYIGMIDEGVNCK